MKAETYLLALSFTAAVLITDIKTDKMEVTTPMWVGCAYAFSAQVEYFSMMWAAVGSLLTFFFSLREGSPGLEARAPSLFFSVGFVFYFLRRGVEMPLLYFALHTPVDVIPESYQLPLFLCTGVPSYFYFLIFLPYVYYLYSFSLGRAAFFPSLSSSSHGREEREEQATQIERSENRSASTIRSRADIRNSAV